MTAWPLQSKCNVFYGDPTKQGFEASKLVRIKTPWALRYGNAPVASLRVHAKCANAYKEWFETIWTNAEKKQWTIDAWGMSAFGGSWIVRQKRAGSTLSMHAYGCATDWDPARNGFRDSTPNFAQSHLIAAIVEPFEKLGGVWGGRWKTNCDGMHFQFAVVG